ncbi:hypothetical protein [Nocardia carnea]|uniref:hypothetical protein n=1 Tax=Nocardia carnea TaxID=37328 RepID=UPI002456F061|nr:hypothetical protein [Nocardia carnea]
MTTFLDNHVATSPGDLPGPDIADLVPTGDPQSTVTDEVDSTRLSGQADIEPVDDLGNPSESREQTPARPTHGQEAGKLLWLDPKKLIRARNRPVKPRDPGVEASVRTHGNQVPLVAVQTGDDEYEVHDGWHRAEILRETEHLAWVAVLPLDASLDDIERTIARVEIQFNTGAHRYEQSEADRFDAMTQMLDLGLEDSEIRDRLVGTTAKEVTAVRKAQKSNLATQAIYDDQLKIDDAALIAERLGDDIDPDLIDELTAAAVDGQLEHCLQQILSDRAQREADEQTTAAFNAWIAPFESSGVTVLHEQPSRYDNYTPLDELVDADGDQPTGQTVPAEYLSVYPVRLAVVDDSGERIPVDLIDPRSYRCPEDDPDPGMYHFAEVSEVDEWEARYYCTDPDAAGLMLPELEDTQPNTDPSAFDDAVEDEDPEVQAARLEREHQLRMQRQRDEQARRAKEAAERQNVVILNRRARDATKVRRDWLITNLFTGKKTVPAGAHELIGRVILHNSDLLNVMAVTSLQWQLGTKVPKAPSSPGIKARDNHGSLRALLAVSAALEAHLQPHDTHPDYYRRVKDLMGDYIRFLASCGYQPAPIERVLTGELTTGQVLGEQPPTPTDNSPTSGSPEAEEQPSEVDTDDDSLDSDLAELDGGETDEDDEGSDLTGDEVDLS